MQSRRSFLKNSSFGLGAIALAQLALADDHATIRPRAKRCIFLNMIGGCSQVDLFDPKPKLAELDGKPLPDSLLKQYRFPGGAALAKETVFLKASPRKFAQHGDSGMVLSDLLPNISAQADRLTMIRSMQADDVIHAPAQMKFATGFPVAGFPSIGSWLSYGLGSMSHSLPSYVVMWSGQSQYRTTSLWSGKPLPGNHSGIPVEASETPIPNLHPSEPTEPAIEQASLNLLRRLNRHHKERFSQGAATPLAESATAEILSIDRRIADYELAFRLQASAPELFDLSKEPESVRRAYGIDRDAGDTSNFAKNCLLARRMIERGVRFVHLFHSHWDHHDDIDIELPNICRVVDQPIATLISDLEQRGLLQDTLVVWGTEFGRTCFAEIRNKQPGRDHHVDAFTIWAAGGGLKPGTTIGRTDELGWQPTERPVHVRDFHATLLHLFGLDQFELEIEVSGRPVRLTDTGGEVIREVLA